MWMRSFRGMAQAYGVINISIPGPMAPNDPLNKIDPSGEEGIVQQGYAMATQAIVIARTYLYYNAVRMAIWANLAVGIARTRLDHILKNHSLWRRAEQVPYIISSKGRDAAELFMKEKTYFPKDWSVNRIHSAVTTAYRFALRNGVINGEYTIVIEGESVTVQIVNQVLRTAYGTKKYGLKDL